MGIWVPPAGRRRPSARIGFPWLASFVVWLCVARWAVEEAWLRTRGLPSWLAWLCVSGVLVPGVVAAVSTIGGIRLRVRALSGAVVAAMGACGVSLVFLFADFAAFAFLGGFAVSIAAAAAYALATSRDLAARQDAEDW